MRYALCAGRIFLLASAVFATEAQAQFSYSGVGDCNKGIFWPFVRNPGDCLTDAERRSGMSGIYRGSDVLQSETAEPGPELETPGSEAPAQAQQLTSPSEEATQSAASLGPHPSPTVVPPTALPSPPVTPATSAATIRPTAAETMPLVTESTSEAVAVPDNRMLYTGPGECTKGVFWPFVRRVGDCLTDAEIRLGRTGTYQ